MITPTRERRDWTLLVFIIPIGIILMLIAGQVAIRLVPKWSINAGMQSSLDPNNLPLQQNGPVQPILPAILTPLGWLDTFLTPGSNSENNDFPPFVIFEPTVTSVVTKLPPTAATTPPPIPTTDTPIVTPTPPVTVTKKTPVEPTATHPTATQPTATQPTATQPTETVTATSIVSTPTGVVITPAPTEVIGTPDSQIYSLKDGTYIVLNLGSNPIQVNGSDPDYDLVYYEMEYYTLFPSGTIYMDQVIIGISNDPNGNSFFTVFNWGSDGVPDMNSNVGEIALLTGEADNQEIPFSALYGTDPYQTGIAIDVDNALSNPPPGLYQYVVIMSPATGSGDSAQVNAIEVIPDPPTAPVVAAPVQPADDVLIVPAEDPVLDAPDPPSENEPSPPAEDEPSPPAENEPSSPAENEPSSPVEEAPSP